MSKKQPPCLAEMYRTLVNKPPTIDSYLDKYVRGENVEDLKVSAEATETREDAPFGFKWAFVRCKNCERTGCETKAYVRFRSGNVINKNPLRFGDMKVGKFYSVPGSTTYDWDNGIVITNSVEVNC